MFMSCGNKGASRVYHIVTFLQAVYIAPLKALVRERMDDWKVRIEQKLGKK
jgi:activating signal cointegrator complex subunit 3